MPEEHQSSQLKGHFPHINTPNPHVQSVDRGLAAAANGYLSYAGPYSIVDDGLIAHHIDVSLLPNWIGGTQYRAALLHGSVLELSPPEPILVGGQRLNARLVWHRA
jgi:hypothetical protein